MVQNHKFHKVYSDHPSAKSAEPVQSNGIIQSSQKTRSRRLSRWISRNGLNFATLVTLILTWVAYLNSNELSRKATILSHTPWLSVTPEVILQASQDDKSLLVSMPVQNTSDSPVFDFHETFALFKTPDGPDIPRMEFTETTELKFKNVLMPRDTRGTTANFSSSTDGSVFSAAKTKDEIESGRQSIAANFYYTDIFGERLTLQVLMRKFPEMDKYSIFKTTISGYTKY